MGYNREGQAIETFPHVLIRIGGLSIDDVISSSNTEVLKKQQEEYLFQEKTILRLRNELISELYFFIGICEEKKTRNYLLNLKRSLHNNRKLKSVENFPIPELKEKVIRYCDQENLLQKLLLRYCYNKI